MHRPSRYRTSSFTITVLLHAAIMIVAALLSLPIPERKPDNDVELHFLPSPFPPAPVGMPEATARRTVTPPSSRQPSITAPKPVTPIVTEAEPSRHEAASTTDDVVEIPARTWQPPPSPFDSEMTPEQAWGLLDSLLREHPEFRDMVLREMLAGQGFVRDSLPPVSFHLEDVMKFEKFLPSWMYEIGRQQGLHPGNYHPVYGHRNPSQYSGPSVNILGLIDFLRGLLSGK